MNYQKHYDLLIERSKNRVIDEYFEIHHIMPVSMGGSNDNDNLVKLTPREHLIAHLLLWKIYKNVSMQRAAFMMSHTRGYKINSRLYEQLRKEHANNLQKEKTGIVFSEERKNNISRSLSGKAKSQEHKDNISLAKKGKPNGRKGQKTGIATSGCFSKGNSPWNKGKEHMKGANNPSFGKKWDQSKKDGMSKTNKGRKRVYREDGTYYYDYSHLNKEANT